MMLDADIVAVSPASVWRVLSWAGLMRKWRGKPSKKGPALHNRRSRTSIGISDGSYLNVCAMFCYLRSILDGYSRFLVQWDLRKSMTEADMGMSGKLVVLTSGRSALVLSTFMALCAVSPGRPIRKTFLSHPTRGRFYLGEDRGQLLHGYE
jgi:hypothetical protein